MMVSKVFFFVCVPTPLFPVCTEVNFLFICFSGENQASVLEQRC